MTMTAKAFLDAADQLSVGTLHDMIGRKGLVVIAPHPDDESLGCGGLIAQALQEQRRVRVAVVSDGVGSHPNSATYPAARLKALRESEARAAVEVLGLDPAFLSFLGLPDCHVPQHGPEAERAVEEITALVDQTEAGGLFVSWRHDPHCDHQASYRLARHVQERRQGLRLFEYVVWGRSLPSRTEVPDALAGLRLDMSGHRARKAAAIACHRSQTTRLIDDDPEGFCLAPDVLQRFQGIHEVFLDLDR